MKYTSEQRTTAIACILAGLFVAPLSAETTEDQSGGFLKVGYGYKFESSPYEDEISKGSLFVSGRYQIDWGLFVEAAFGANELQQGLSYGYNFYNTESWNFDLMTLRAHGDTTLVVTNQNEDVSLFKQNDTDMIGFRATGYYGQTRLQFIAAPYSLNDNVEDAFYASAWLAHSWQVKNWEIQAMTGVQLRSAEILDHYYGTPDVLVGESLPEYEAGSGLDYTAQIGVAYPLTENILFESYFRYTKVSSAVTDSPFIQQITMQPNRSDNVTEFGVLFSYVF